MFEITKTIFVDWYKSCAIGIMIFKSYLLNLFQL